MIYLRSREGGGQKANPSLERRETAAQILEEENSNVYKMDGNKNLYVVKR